jgi:acyl-CoA synthetase (AMP-forming)/AMP-acid ligase II
MTNQRANSATKSATTICELIAARDPLGIWCRTPNGETITFDELLSSTERLSRRLNSVAQVSGTARHEDEITIALVLPQGVQLAVALLASMYCGIAAPLNPKGTAAEFACSFENLRPSVIITDPSLYPKAIEAASNLGIEVRNFSDSNSSLTLADSGTFSSGVAPSLRTAADVALTLETSGTTARPKRVDLTHAQLLHSARSVATTIELNATDHGLVMMPLFHIHGIVGSLLSSLTTGASVVIAPFDPIQFNRLVSKARPTWMSAVPTMLQAITSRETSSPFQGMRLIRSSSAPLADSVWTDVERLYGCPIVNSYGMTEAAHQVTSNGLSANRRQFGTVGWPVDLDLNVQPEAGPQAAFGEGEILIRGVSVIQSYGWRDPASEDPFVDGWFRTGDRGTVRENKCVTLNGRLKELINVAGEKVSPFEVENALQLHPLVTTAVAFATPCPHRGEQVSAVVTVCGEVTNSELRTFVRELLAKHKTPQRIHIVDQIPLGPTGKVQRRLLGATFSE